MPTFGSLFAGIGGIDLGLERAGWTGRWQVEWDPYCQHVLAHHWPDVPRYGDIRSVHGAAACPDADSGRLVGSEHRGERTPGMAEAEPPGDRCGGCLTPVDLIAGGFPCQPWSMAGKQRGLADHRWLWPEFERTIRELRPRYVLVENVSGLLAGRGGMGAVLGGLASLGYDAEWDCIPASSVGAPHRRDRVWIVAHRTEQSGPLADTHDGGSLDAVRAGRDAARDGRTDVAHALGRRQPGSRQPLDAIRPEAPGHGEATHAVDGRVANQWAAEPNVGRVAHGVPGRVDRLRALGNAVVPQVVEFIGRRILEAEGLT